MKKFLLYAGLFAFLIILTLAAGELWVRRMPNPYAAKNSYALVEGHSITTVILGSSHTYFGVIADSIGPDVLNLANVSQNFEYDYRLLSHYLPYFPNLRTVVIPVSYFSFFDPPFAEGPEKWNESFYRIYMDIDKHSRFSPYFFEISNLPVYTGKIKGAFSGKRRALSSPQGFGLDYALGNRSADWKKTAETHAAYHTAPDFSRLEFNKAWCDSLLSLCSDHNLRVILISTPVVAEYRARLDSAQLARTRQLTDSFSRVFAIPYLDFSANPEFSDPDFFDADHLSDIGARKFSRMLQPSL